MAGAQDGEQVVAGVAELAVLESGVGEQSGGTSAVQGGAVHAQQVTGVAGVSHSRWSIPAAVGGGVQAGWLRSLTSWGSSTRQLTGVLSR